MQESISTRSKNSETSGFETICEKSGSLTLVDLKNKIVKIEWHGTVDLTTAKEILTKGADLIEAGHCNRLLLNREGLAAFSTEARIWIKQDLLRTRAKKLVSKVQKVATVSAATSIGKIVSNFVSTAIKLVFPGLQMSKFEGEGAAMDWLVE